MYQNQDDALEDVIIGEIFLLSFQVFWLNQQSIMVCGLYFGDVPGFNVLDAYDTYAVAWKDTQ